MTETTATPKAVTTCGCLCGQPVAPRSTFRQGHDQRMVGALGRTAGVCDVEPVWVQRLELPENINTFDIVDLIAAVSDAVSKHYSPSLGNKVYSAAERAWQKSAKAKPADLAETGRKVTEQNRTAGAVKVPSAAAIASEIKNARMLERQYAEANGEEYATVPGAPIRVKVGRWEYDATIHGMNQSGKVTAVRYDTAGGKEVVKTEGQFTII